VQKIILPYFSFNDLSLLKIMGKRIFLLCFIIISSGLYLAGSINEASFIAPSPHFSFLTAQHSNKAVYTKFSTAYSSYKPVTRPVYRVKARECSSAALSGLNIVFISRLPYCTRSSTVYLPVFYGNSCKASNSLRGPPQLLA